jgi:hypothetical protein
MTNDLPYRRGIVFGLALLGFVLICLAQTTTRAAALTVNCRGISAAEAMQSGADFAIALTRIAVLRLNPRKRDTDLFRLLVSNVHQGTLGDMVLVWHTLMCQAERDEPTARELLARWSTNLGPMTQAFKVSWAMDLWLDRIARAPRGEHRLLTQLEKQLLADTLEHLANAVGEPFDMLKDVLGEEFDLPKAGPKI